MNYKNYLYKVKESKLLLKTIETMNRLESESLKNYTFLTFVKNNFNIKRDKITNIIKVHFWVFNNIRYKKDDYDETLISPRLMLFYRYGDCDDFALLTHSILKALNVKVNYILLGKRKDGFSHIAVVSEVNNLYIYIDSTLKTFGVIPKVYKFFKII